MTTIDTKVEEVNVKETKPYVPSVAVIREIQIAKEAINNAAVNIQNMEYSALRDIMYMHSGLQITLDNILKTNELYNVLIMELDSLRDMSANTNNISPYYVEFLTRLKLTLKNAVNANDVCYIHTKFLPYMDNINNLTDEVLMDAINELSLIEIHKSVIKEQVANELGNTKLPWYKRWFKLPKTIKQV